MKEFLPDFGSKTITVIRNKYTNGKFMTLTEYDKYIRKKKINKLNANNE